MNRIRQPFNVNSLAQAAARAALDDDANVRCVGDRAGPALPLDEFIYLSVLPSRANFILVDVVGARPTSYQKLPSPRRDRAPRHPSAGDRAAITVGTPEENRKLVKALRAVEKTS